MKYYTHYTQQLLLLAISVLLLFSCKKVDGYNDIVSTDMTKPEPVTNVKVTNFNGGAYITYTLPKSANILYVQANYKINEQSSRQTKSSYYSDSITVSGFAKSQEYDVELLVVSRAQVMSEPVHVKVHPDTPAYLLTRPTIKIRQDFGGVQITAINRAKANIGVVTIAPDKMDKYQIISQNYTDQDSITFSLHGYDTIPQQFGVYVTDQWGNISDTAYATITPVYETQMDKSLFRSYQLGTDARTGFGWSIENLWNNSTQSPGYHTEQPIQPLVWPAVITFDMGKATRLSRYTIWNRGIDGSGNWLWQAGAPQTWVLWGREDTPEDETMPDEQHLPPVGGVTPKGWINLGYFTAYDKPSKLPNPQYNNADLAFWNAGFSYNFSLNLPKVRYMRFQCISNMAQTNSFFNIIELTFWGDPR
ncbi:DUF4959 domain-containing protein [Chitinophaga rhizophila]|uniref:DUF4959 domain-containing protein n=1 Tax=Chitinophaga rhizophila TaxID=2866212 RepID=A0ABS7GDS8_9BACT|nr:DUF4959 domain-containing protein [Chitinophaga rhizophila]MBW8685310.1 DUF4959 domain-containing protein [Chitinophaga rhizophila]